MKGYLRKPSSGELWLRCYCVYLPCTLHLATCNFAHQNRSGVCMPLDHALLVVSFNAKYPSCSIFQLSPPSTPPFFPFPSFLKNQMLCSDDAICGSRIPRDRQRVNSLQAPLSKTLLFVIGINADAVQDAIACIPLFLSPKPCPHSVIRQRIRFKLSLHGACMMHAQKIFIFSSHRPLAMTPGPPVAADRESL